MVELLRQPGALGAGVGVAPGRLPARFGGVMGSMLLRPWFDALALRGIVRWFFPLSRAWAAAEMAGRDVERFCAELASVAPPPHGMLRRTVGHALDLTATRRRSYLAAAEAWEEAFFRAAAPAMASLVAAETARAAAAQAWMATRSAFLPLHCLRGIPPLKWAAAGESEVERRHGARLADPARAFPPPALAETTLSRRVPSECGQVRWLRFPATVAGAADMAWARVVEPIAARDPPTLILLHGIGVETEFWNADLGRVDRLTDAGIRIVRPEGPWHGRRRPAGWFGGEPVMAQGPLGLLDLFAAWVAELALLVAWARSTSRGPVAVGGISLGALTGQLAATVAAGWPAAMRPDALLLVGTTGDVIGAATRGGLASALGIGRRMTEQAWTPASAQRWAPLVEPQGPPVVAPEAIVMVIGTRDVVTPFAGGMELARRWAVPRDNLFLRRQGHFSVALGLEHDAAPLQRIAAILRRLR